MSSRDTVLRRIREAVGGATEGRSPALPVPRDYLTAGTVAPNSVVDLFAERVDDYHATVTRTSTRELPAAIAAIVAYSDHRRLIAPPGLPPDWLSRVPADIRMLIDDPPRSIEEIGACDGVITAATLAIAETGTIVLDGSSGQGRRAISLVPNHHICIVRGDQVVPTVPDAIARLEPTRPQTWISGPSATSDIELDRVEGVHGPRTLDVIVIDGDS